MKKIFLSILLMVFICTAKAEALDLSAECACVIIAQTGECIFSKNADKTHSVASTTKIMTAITAIEEGNIQEVVSVSANAASQEGSSIYLRAGNRINLLDLIYGMMLNSGNDAACAVAEHIGGDVESFAVLMNEKAKKAGAKNTSFKNPSGLDEEGHFSTAEDMARITAYALKNELFSNIVSTKNAQIKVGEDICYLKNHNKMLWNYDGCIGVKTGYTKKTGRCLVSAAEKDGITLIAVTLGAPDDWCDHEKMLDYGFANTELKTIVEKGEKLKNITGDGYSLNAVAGKSVKIPAKKNSRLKSEIILHTVKKPTLEIMKGEKIGYAEIMCGGKSVTQIDLTADRTAFPEKKEGFFLTIFRMIKKLLLKE